MIGKRVNSLTFHIHGAKDVQVMKASQTNRAMILLQNHLVADVLAQRGAEVAQAEIPNEPIHPDLNLKGRENSGGVVGEHQRGLGRNAALWFLRMVQSLSFSSFLENKASPWASPLIREKVI